jgi:MFS family permease
VDAVRSPLRRRGFALLWAGGLINDLGDWLLLIALPVYVFQLTGSAFVTSTVFVVELVTGLIAGQLAGVAVDRWDRRRILVVSGVIQAVFLLPLLVVDGGNLWIVYVVAAVQSCFARLCSPAKAALVPSLVERDELGAANSLSAVADNLARLVGAAAGGLALQVFGLPGVVVIDAVTYLLSSLLIAGIRIPAIGASAGSAGPAGDPIPAVAPGRGVAGRLVADWVDGLRTIRRDRDLRSVVVIGALSQLSQGIFVVLFVVFVLDRLGGSSGDVGLIRGMQAIGGIAGGIFVGAIARRTGSRELIGWGLVLFGLISLVTWNLPAVTTAIAVYVALFVIVGVPGVAAITGLMTAVQTLSPPSHLGRVFAAFETAAGALAAVGVLAAGALADRVGVVAILDVQALIYVGCGVLALVVLRAGAGRPVPAPTA